MLISKSLFEDGFICRPTNKKPSTYVSGLIENDLGVALYLAPRLHCFP